VSAPVLAYFDENIDICVQTDASLVGLGAVLTQYSGEGPRPIAYISRRLTEAESKYHANELVFSDRVGLKKVTTLCV